MLLLNAHKHPHTLGIQSLGKQDSNIHQNAESLCVVVLSERGSFHCHFYFLIIIIIILGLQPKTKPNENVFFLTHKALNMLGSCGDESVQIFDQLVALLDDGRHGVLRTRGEGEKEEKKKREEESAKKKNQRQQAALKSQINSTLLQPAMSKADMRPTSSPNTTSIAAVRT